MNKITNSYIYNDLNFLLLFFFHIPFCVFAVFHRFNCLKGGYTDHDCSRLVQISQSLKVSSTDSTPAHTVADKPKAILAAAEQAKAIQKAADKARQEAAAAERLRVEELKAEQAAADQLKADQVIAAAVVAAETAQVLLEL